MGNWVESLIILSLISIITILVIDNRAYAELPSLSFTQHPIGSNAERADFYLYDPSLTNDPVKHTTTVTITTSCSPTPIPFQLDDERHSGYFFSPKIVTQLGCSTPYYDPQTGILKVENQQIVRVDSSQYAIYDEATISTPSSDDILWAKKRLNGNYPTNSASGDTNTKCQAYGGDSDGDGICNNWENGSLQINYPYASSPYTLSCGTPTSEDPVCPSPTKKDIYIELDYMTFHKPDQRSIDNLKKVFESSGITLHFLVDEEIGHKSDLRWNGYDYSWGYGFQQVKAKWFGTASERSDPNWNAKWPNKKEVFHYALSVHKQTENLSQTGVAEPWGNDFMISGGVMPDKVFPMQYEEATILHELGHNLGLNHGGGDNINCKPNYISVMNYHYQYPIEDPYRALNYSHIQLPALNELNNGLNEQTGITSYKINGAEQNVVWYGPLGIPNAPGTWKTGGTWIDWNQDSQIQTALSMSIHQDPGLIDCQGSSQTSLNGYNDWESLKFSSWGSGYFSSSMTYEQIQEKQVNILVGLKIAILALDDSDFVNPQDATLTKKNYSQRIDQAIYYVNKNEYKSAEKEIKKLEPTLDGIGNDDLIKSDVAKKKGISARIAGIIEAEEIISNVPIGKSHSDIVDKDNPCSTGNKLENDKCVMIDQPKSSSFCKNNEVYVIALWLNKEKCVEYALYHTTMYSSTPVVLSLNKDSTFVTNVPKPFEESTLKAP